MARSKSLTALWRRILPDAAFVVLALGLCLLFFWRIVTPNLADRAAFPKGDFVEQFYPSFFYKAQALTQGRLPLWNPYVYGGHPFLADIQSAVFYPITLVTIALTSRGGPSIFALEVEAIFHFFLASVFTYFLAKRLVKGRFGAMVAALVFTYAGYLTSYPSQQLSILEVQVWLPLVLLLADMALEASDTRQRLGLLALGSMALAFSTLAGHPMSSMYVIYTLIAYFLYKGYWQIRAQRLALWSRPAGALLGQFALFLALGLGLAAVQLVPTYEFTRLSTRAVLSYKAAEWGFPLKDVVQVLLPGLVSQYSPMYLGILPLILAALGLLRGPRRWIAFWVVLGGTALLLSFGGHTFLYGFFRQAIPGISIFRNQERAIFLFSFAASLLAGYGGQWLVGATTTDDDLLHKAARFLWWVALGGVVFFLFLFVAEVSTERLAKWIDAGALLVILLFLSAAVVQLRWRPGGNMVLVGILAVAVALFDLFSVNWRTNLAETKPEDYFASTIITQRLQEETESYRTDNEFRLPLTYGSVYRIADIRGASPLQMQRYKDLTSTLPRERVWQLLNVKYLLTWEGGKGESLTHLLSEKLHGEDSHLYQWQTPLPRAYVVYEAVVEPDDQKALQRLASSAFEPKRAVILSEAPGLELEIKPAVPSSVNIISYLPEKVVLQARLPENGILVLSENYYPGWQAKVDGVATPILRANVTQRAIALAGGEHSVELVFDPLSLKLGAAISGLALMICLGLMGLWWHQGRP